jgi:putative ABC transport system permease protein
MKLKKSFHLALNILFHSKLRSWLTIIGIIIGIAAVVAIISISQGAEQQISSRLGALGANIITISPGASRARGFSFGGGEAFGNSGTTSTTTQKNLTEKDVIVLKGVPNVVEVMGSVSGRANVIHSTQTANNLNIQGVDVSVWKDITTESLTSGRLLSQGDSLSVVIGSSVASSVFNTPISINDKLVIDGISFNVVGIIQSGSTVYMPIDIARTVLADTNNNVGHDDFSSISVKISDVNIANDTVTAITQDLMYSRGIFQASKIDFSVNSPVTIQQNVQQTLNTTSLFLGAIAAISLIVGAIGIANSMFTSVLERTRDIGIMKAIGAKNRDILTIFLLNSGLIGLVGGIGGIIVGFFLSTAINSFSGSSATSTAGAVGRGAGGFGNFLSSSIVTPQLVIGALVVSMLIGMIAGLIPAYRASRLSPVEALRYE